MYIELGMRAIYVNISWINIFKGKKRVNMRRDVLKIVGRLSVSHGSLVVFEDERAMAACFCADSFQQRDEL